MTDKKCDCRKTSIDFGFPAAMFILCWFLYYGKDAVIEIIQAFK